MPQSDPDRRVRILRARAFIAEAVADQVKPAPGDGPTTVIYMTGCTVTVAEPAARPATMVPEPA